MGRSRSGNRRVANANSRGQRPIPLDLFPLSRFEAVLSPWPDRRFWPEVEDRRTYHPEGSGRPFRTIWGGRHRLKIGSASSSTRSFRVVAPSSVVMFEQPGAVMVCRRRKVRREVMFATRRAGRGGQRTPVWNEASRISCGRRS